MPPEGPWQRLHSCRSNGGGCFYIPVSWRQTGLAGHSRAPTTDRKDKGKTKENSAPPQKESRTRRKDKQRKDEGGVHCRRGLPSLLSVTDLPRPRGNSLRSYAPDSRRETPSVGVCVISLIWPATCGPKGHGSNGIAFTNNRILFQTGVTVKVGRPSLLCLKSAEKKMRRKGKTKKQTF